MSEARIPVSCPSCGALFASRSFKLSEGATRITLVGNKESCIRCGELANVADGAFSVVDDVLEVLAGPEWTREKIAALGDLAAEARERGLSHEEVARRAAEISPVFGALVERLADKNLVLALLFTIIALTCRANLDVKVDVNQLVDQAITILSENGGGDE